MKSRLWGGGGQGFCDVYVSLISIKRDDVGRGITNCPKLRDVIYGRPHYKIVDGKF